MATRYRDFAPTGFDSKGLGLPDQQDWFVLPIMGIALEITYHFERRYRESHGMCRDCGHRLVSRRGRCPGCGVRIGPG